MSLSENKAILRRFVEEVQSQHHLDVAKELMIPNMIEHYAETQGRPHTENTIEDFKKFYSNWLAAFSDLTASFTIRSPKVTAVNEKNRGFCGISPLCLTKTLGR